MKTVRGMGVFLSCRKLLSRLRNGGSRNDHQTGKTDTGILPPPPGLWLLIPDYIHVSSLSGSSSVNVCAQKSLLAVIIIKQIWVWMNNLWFLYIFNSDTLDYDKQQQWTGCSESSISGGFMLYKLFRLQQQTNNWCCRPAQFSKVPKMVVR